MDVDLVWRLIGGREGADFSVRQVTIERHPQRPGAETAMIELDSPALTVALRPGAGGAVQTARFALSVVARDHGTPLDPAQRAALDALAAEIREHEGDLDLTQPWDRAAPAEASGRPTLWVVPGHIGALADLPVRAIELLKDCPSWALEAGTSDAVDQVCAAFGIDRSTKRILWIPNHGLRKPSDVVQAWIRHGGDLCLFGGGEGIPVVCDPGWALVDAVRGFPGQADVRAVGCGGALMTALMLRGAKSPAYTFLGTFPMAFLDHVATLHGGSTMPLMAYATGASLKTAWPSLADAVAGLCGQLWLFVELTRTDEQVLCLELPLAAIPAIDEDAKVVVRLEGWSPN